MRILISLTAIVAFATAAAAEDPFAAWSQKQVAEHRKAAEAKITENAVAHLGSLANLLVTCPQCRGRGVVGKETCNWCRGEKKTLSKEDFKRVFLEFDTRRNDPSFIRSIDRQLKEWKANLDHARAHQIRIDGKPTVEVVVHGNHATVTSLRRRVAAAPSKFEEEWIFDGVEWCLAGRHDAPLPRWTYPDPDELPDPPTLPRAERTGETVTIIAALDPITLRVERADGKHEDLVLAGVVHPKDVEGLADVERAAELARCYLGRFAGKRVYLRPAKGLKAGILVFLAEAGGTRRTKAGDLIQLTAVDGGDLAALRGVSWEYDEHFAAYEARAKDEEQGIWDPARRARADAGD